MPEVVRESIGRLCTVEMRFRPSPHGLPRDVTVKLYDAARQHAGVPLTYPAARRLINSIEAGDRVFVICGSGSRPYMEPNHATLAAAGLAVHDDEEVFAVRPRSVLSFEFPYGMNTRPQIDALFDQHDPAAVVFVERTGPNAEGIFHLVTGTPKKLDAVVANLLFAEVARSRDLHTRRWNTACCRPVYGGRRSRWSLHEPRHGCRRHLVAHPAVPRDDAARDRHSGAYRTRSDLLPHGTRAPLWVGNQTPEQAPE